MLGLKQRHTINFSCVDTHKNNLTLNYDKMYYLSSLIYLNKVKPNLKGSYYLNVVKTFE